MLLNSTQGIPSSQHEEESSLLRSKIEEESSLLRSKIEEESSLLRSNIEELNKNTVVLIAEAGKLIQASKHLSIRLQSFERPPAQREAGT
jgi:hypothetical protein